MCQCTEVTFIQTHTHTATNTQWHKQTDTFEVKQKHCCLMTHHSLIYIQCKFQTLPKEHFFCCHLFIFHSFSFVSLSLSFLSLNQPPVLSFYLLYYLSQPSIFSLLSSQPSTSLLLPHTHWHTHMHRLTNTQTHTHTVSCTRPFCSSTVAAPKS